MDLSSWDLRLGDGSPLIDQGSAMTAQGGAHEFPNPLREIGFVPPVRVRVDAAQLRAPGGPLDIGAFEVGTGEPPPDPGGGSGQGGSGQAARIRAARIRAAQDRAARIRAARDRAARVKLGPQARRRAQEVRVPTTAVVGVVLPALMIRISRSWHSGCRCWELWCVGVGALEPRP